MKRLIAVLAILMTIAMLLPACGCGNCEQVERDLGKVTAELAKAKSDLSAALAEKDAALAEKDLIEKELSEAKKDLAVAISVGENATQKIGELEGYISELKGKLGDKDLEISELERYISELEDKLNEAEATSQILSSVLPEYNDGPFVVKMGISSLEYYFLGTLTAVDVVDKVVTLNGTFEIPISTYAISGEPGQTLNLGNLSIGEEILIQAYYTPVINRTEGMVVYQGDIIDIILAYMFNNK